MRKEDEASCAFPAISMGSKRLSENEPPLPRPRKIAENQGGADRTMNKSPINTEAAETDSHKPMRQKSSPPLFQLSRHLHPLSQ